MANYRGMVAMAATAALMTFGTTGCDDDDRAGGGGGGAACVVDADCPAGQICVAGTCQAPGSTTTMGSTTTTTTSSTSSTTTTTMATTTTTMGPGMGFTCDVVIGVTTNETMGSLQYDVDYTGAAPGGFEGAADAVNCTASGAIAGAIVTFNDDEAASTLRTGIISLAGFTGPTDVATCVYIKDSGAEPVAGDFGITLVDAADPSFTPITPSVEITSISCTGGGGGGGTTTTSTTTSTTTTSTTTTTTTPGVGGSQFQVLLDVADALSFGALQFDVDYSGAPGGFNGSADSVTCTAGAAIAGSIVTFNDDEAASTLRTGIISLAGFTGPANLADCTFDSTGATPTAGDFTVTVIDASDPGLAPIVPLPTVSISAINPL